jgi:hypothetical protein
MKLSKVIMASAVATAISLPHAVRAESNFTTGGGANITATARVDFSVSIPKFVLLQVGTLGTNNVDTISFAVPAANVGDGTVVAGTGGNLTGGQVTVRVVGNNGNMTLGATAGANLLSGADTIPWTEISTAITGGATHPAINGANATYTATNKVVNVNGTWTYSYLNTNGFVPAFGTYTGTVTYTATTP